MADVEELKFQWLWNCGYWDGPLSGVVVLENGTLAWAQATEVYPYRTFNFYGLTQDEWQNEIRTHADFVRYVGYHFDYPDREQGVVYTGNKDDADVFYTKYPPGSLERNYNNNQLLGSVRIKWYGDDDEDDE